LQYFDSGVGAAQHGSDTLTVTATDSLGAAAASKTIDVTFDANPVLNGQGVYFVDQGLATPLGGLRLSDADAAQGEQFTVFLSSVSRLTGLPVGVLSVTGPGVVDNGDYFAISGTLDEVNAALATVTYTDTTSGLVQFSVSAADGSVGSAGLSAIIDPRPVITAPDSLALRSGAPADLYPAIQVSDASADGVHEKVTLVVQTAHGRFRDSSGNDVGSTVTLIGSPAEANQQLNLLQYVDSGVGAAQHGSDTLTVTATDSLGAAAASKTIDVTFDANPVLHAAPRYVVDQGVATVLGGLSVSDVDATASEVLTVDLSVDSGTLSDNAAGASSPTPQHLHISGALTDINTALAAVNYRGDGGAQLFGSATDGQGGSFVTALATINARPVISAPGAVLVQRDQATAVPGVSVADADAASAGEILTVTLSENAGSLSAAGAGVSGSGSNVLTITGSLTQVNAALATLTEKEASASDMITISASDSRGGLPNRRQSRS
jgi:hypothetical protein